jgi:hypothetical protein
VVFDAQGIRIVDAAAQLGGGAVTFGGRIGLNGFRLGSIDLTARGDQMHLRYPENFRSTIDADLTLRGDPLLLVLGGTVTVRDGLYSKRIEPNIDIYSLVAGGSELPAPGGRNGVAAGPLRRAGARARGRCGSTTTSRRSSRAPISP